MCSHISYSEAVQYLRLAPYRDHRHTTKNNWGRVLLYMYIHVHVYVHKYMYMYMFDRLMVSFLALPLPVVSANLEGSGKLFGEYSCLSCTYV